MQLCVCVCARASIWHMADGRRSWEGCYLAGVAIAATGGGQLRSFGNYNAAFKTWAHRKGPDSFEGVVPSLIPFPLDCFQGNQ